MTFQEIALLHKVGFQQVLAYWPIVIFIMMGEMFCLLRSRQFTRRGALEATLSTSIPFLIAFWGVSVAPSMPPSDGTVAYHASVLLTAGLAAFGIMIRIAIVQIFYEVKSFWAYFACALLPLFVYFTAWVAVK